MSDPMRCLRRLHIRLTPIGLIGLLLAMLSLTVWSAQAGDSPLRPVSLGADSSGIVQNLSGDDRLTTDRQALVRAIDYSLRYLQTDAASTAYRQYPDPAFTRERVRRSLVRFRQLLLTYRSPQTLQAMVAREFDFYQSIGSDGSGTVLFTGYFAPTYVASRVPTAEFRYPIYRLPPDFTQWRQPQPTRVQLEGRDGLAQSQLKGLELVWLRDRLEAYLVQVQGSARLQLTDGTTMSVSVAGHTAYPYTSVGRELVNAGKIPSDQLSLPAVIAYFRQNPADLDTYLPRNNRFVFFQETTGMPATGSLGVPVTAERSIATDKALMPPGALALIHLQLPDHGSASSRYVLDQDTGSAIRGAGRVDIFMGTGVQAGDRAGRINASGQLYYLLLKR